MIPWFARFSGSATASRLLGPLEWKVLETLWSRDAPASVRDMRPEFPGIAYTTLMTTLDRLHRKGILARTKQGRAFLYRPQVSRTEFESVQAAHVLRAALQNGGATLGPLLSCFVDAVGDRDRALLDELEALVRARRAEIEDKRS
jgi:predicted transcriptional regulator